MSTHADPSTWSRLENTYWCVPPESLPALRFDQDGNTLTWRVDQTVWHITGYRDGYFWGVCGALMRDAGEPAPERGPGAQPQGFTMLGSITPEGQVHLTFIPVSRGPDTLGIGRVVLHGAEPSFEMQMSTGSGAQTNAHWAYMVPVRPDDPSWHSLPGIGLSVPEMLEGLEPPVVASP
jgi:hypothetical protein